MKWNMKIFNCSTSKISSFKRLSSNHCMCIANIWHQVCRKNFEPFTWGFTIWRCHGCFACYHNGWTCHYFTLSVTKTKHKHPYNNETIMLTFIQGAFHSPKISEILIRNQMARSVSVRCDRNIRVHLWRWSILTGRTGISRSIFMNWLPYSH